VKSAIRSTDGVGVQRSILERLPCPPVLLRVRGALIQHLAAHRLPPEVEFLVVGSSPSDRVRALGDEPGVTVTGFVEDPRDYLERADVVVTPMRHGAVMQNKVLEAMTLARPVVTTSLAREGIDAVDDETLSSPTVPVRSQTRRPNYSIAARTVVDSEQTRATTSLRSTRGVRSVRTSEKRLPEFSNSPCSAHFSLP